MRRLSRQIRLLTAVIAALVLPIVLPSTASGRVIDNEKYQFTVSHIEQEEHGADFCQNVEFLVRYQAEVEGRLLIKTANGPFPYFADRFQSTETYTNLENDKTLTHVFATRNADQRIVDNGDGTITITVKSTGRDFVYGPDGSRLFVDAGQFQFQIVVDYNGTPENPDDDEFVADLGAVKQTGRNDTEGRDFCDDLVTILG